MAIERGIYPEDMAVSRRKMTNTVKTDKQKLLGLGMFGGTLVLDKSKHCLTLPQPLLAASPAA